jgi:hypothetical protein
MAKWLTRWSAKPVFMGSNPIRCSTKQTTYARNGKQDKPTEPHSYARLLLVRLRIANIEEHTGQVQGRFLRRMKRAKGFAWEFRINVVKGGVSKTEYVTLSGAEFPTEKRPSKTSISAPECE